MVNRKLKQKQKKIKKILHKKRDSIVNNTPEIDVSIYLHLCLL